VVVSPAPFGPRKPKTSRWGTTKEIPSTADTSAKRFFRFSTDIAGASLTGAFSQIVARESRAETGTPALTAYLRHPAHAGMPLSSRSFRTASPFFTFAAMMAGLPSYVIRDPFTSTESPFASFVSSRSTYHSGPR